MQVVAPRFFQKSKPRRAGAGVGATKIGDKEYKVDKPKSEFTAFMLHVIPRAAFYSATYLTYGKKGVIALAAADAGVTTFIGLSKLAADGGGMKAAFRGAARVFRRGLYAGLAATTMFVAATFGLPAAQNALFNAKNAGTWGVSLNDQIARKMITKGEIKAGSSVLVTNGTSTATCSNLQVSKGLGSDQWTFKCDVKGKQFGGKRTLLSQEFPNRSMSWDNRGENLVVGDTDYFRNIDASALQLKENIKLPPRNMTAAEASAQRKALTAYLQNHGK